MLFLEQSNSLDPIKPFIRFTPDVVHFVLVCYLGVEVGVVGAHRKAVYERIVDEVEQAMSILK